VENLRHIGVLGKTRQYDISPISVPFLAILGDEKMKAKQETRCPAPPWPGGGAVSASIQRVQL